MGYIYLIQHGSSTMFKIGIATNVESRLAQLQTGNPQELVLFCAYEFPAGAEHVERVLHQKWSDVRKRGEWFELISRDCEQFETICSLLGGTPYVPNTDKATPNALAEAEELGESFDPNALVRWDYAAMFADGWQMHPANDGDGRTGYWCWRKRKNGEKGYLYGGKLEDLPNSIEDMRRIYRDGGLK